MKIAIVGATGVVGRKILELLFEENLIKGNKITLFASKNSAGTIIRKNGKSFTVKELCEANIKNFDLTLFSAGGKISKDWAKKFIEKGSFVVDNSSAYRRDVFVPLVVPEINSNEISKETKLIANPNCSTIQLALPVFALNKYKKIKRVIVSTYQAVSGAGKIALEDLKNGTTKKMLYPIKNNVIPQIDVFLDNDYTYEEDKLIFETQKILKQKINLSATAVRVPVENCHSESVNIEFKGKVDIEKIKKILSNTKGIVLLDEPSKNKYPMPIIANEKNEIFVGRIRKDESRKNAINLFIVADNIRKGAATNAVQIGKYILNNLIKD